MFRETGKWLLPSEEMVGVEKQDVNFSGRGLCYHSHSLLYLALKLGDAAQRLDKGQEAVCLPSSWGEGQCWIRGRTCRKPPGGLHSFDEIPGTIGRGSRGLCSKFEERSGVLEPSSEGGKIWFKAVQTSRNTAIQMPSSVTCTGSASLMHKLTTPDTFVLNGPVLRFEIYNVYFFQEPWKM